MEKIDLNVAKLAKVTDDNIIGESFIANPDKSLLPKLGVLFGIIQIYDQNDAFVDGFIEAIKDLQTEYYLPPYNLERGVEKRFEEALARTNRRLVQAINSSIEEVDLRQTAAVMGVFLDQKVFFTGAGRAVGLFCRRKKNSELLILDVLNTTQETPPVPDKEKFFANILSGEIAPGAAMIFANSEILNGFTTEQIAETIADEPATSSSKNLETQLEDKLPKDNLYAIIIGAGQAPIPPEATPAVIATTVIAPKPRAITAQTAPKVELKAQATMKSSTGALPNQANAKNAPRTQQSLDRLLYTQAKTERYLTPSLLPNWKKIILLTYAKSKAGLFWLGRLLKTGAKKSTSLTGELIKKIPKNSTGKTLKNQPLAAITPDEPIDSKSQLDEIMAEAEDLEVVPAEMVDKKEAKISNVAEKPEGKITSLINSAINERIEFFLNLKKTQQIILAAALILLFIFSQSIVMIGRSYDQTDISPTDKNTKQIESLLNDAEAKNIFSDEPGALASLKEARQLLAQIPNRGSTKTVQAMLQQKVDAAAQELEKIAVINSPKPIADFSVGQTTSNLVGLGKTGRVFWSFDNNNRTLDRFDPQVGKVEMRTSTLAQVKRITAADDKTLILQATDGLYKYDIKSNSATPIKTTKNYFAIKYTGLDFSSPLFDPPLATSTVTMSLLSANDVFLLDSTNGRVIVFNNQNVLERQYESLDFVGAEALTASLTDKKIWLSKNGKVYQIDLDF